MVQYEQKEKFNKGTETINNQTEILELKTTINILKNLIGASTSDSIEQSKEPVNSKTTHLKVVRGS